MSPQHAAFVHLELPFQMEIHESWKNGLPLLIWSSPCSNRSNALVYETHYNEIKLCRISRDVSPPELIHYIQELIQQITLHVTYELFINGVHHMMMRIKELLLEMGKINSYQKFFRGFVDGKLVLAIVRSVHYHQLSYH